MIDTASSNPTNSGFSNDSLSFAEEFANRNSPLPETIKSARPETTPHVGRKCTSSPLVATRIGLGFLTVSLLAMFFALIAQAAPSDSPINALLWVATIAVCSLCGVICMRSARTLQVIESELRGRNPNDASWQTVRPIIGSDIVTENWNDLLEDARGIQQLTQPARTVAALDQEVVTLARAMRGLPIAWVITDAKGAVRYISSATCAMLALNESDSLVGCDLLNILGLCEDQPEAKNSEQARRSLLGPVRMVNHRSAVKINDTMLQLRICRSHLSGRQGDRQGLAWVIFDETQQHAANQARDDFLTTATHELRTPLANLQAYAEALQDEEQLEIERQKEFCNIITSESLRLGRLVDELLAVNQMQAGALMAKKIELELQPVIQYTIDQLQAQADQKQIELAIHLSAKLSTVLGDRNQLQAAMVNLVGNAIKYTQQGGAVSVSCTEQASWIEVDVQDNGPGIALEDQSRIFDKFFRGSNVDQSAARGNGLGLAFSRQIARLHGGEIELKESTSTGSTFRFRLPVYGESHSGI